MEIMYSVLVFAMLFSTASAQAIDIGGYCTSGNTCTNSEDPTIGLACDLKLPDPVCAIKVTQSCAGNTDRCVTGAACYSGISFCECTVTGYEDDGSTGFCKVSDGKIGGTCSSSIPCGQNAACPSTGTLVCACNSGYTAPNGATDCTDEDLGATCASSDTCTNSANGAIGLACDLKLSAPVCAIKVTQSCAGNTDKCVTGAECSSGNTPVCACTVTGYEDDGSTQLCKVTDGKIGGTCATTADCGTNSQATCVSQKCTCNTGYSAADGASVCTKPAEGGAASAVVSTVTLLLSVVIALRCFL